MYLLEASKVFLFSKILMGKYYYLSKGTNDLYENSYTYYLVNKLISKIKIFFIYSFLGRITEITEGNSDILYESKVINWVINLCKVGKYKIIYYFKTSISYTFFLEMSRDIHSFTVRKMSIIIITTVLTDISLTILFKNGIDLSGWIIRGLILFTGLGGIFCGAGWEDVKKESFTVKFINNNCKIRK